MTSEDAGPLYRFQNPQAVQVRIKFPEATLQMLQSEPESCSPFGDLIEIVWQFQQVHFGFQKNANIGIFLSAINQ